MKTIKIISVVSLVLIAFLIHAAESVVARGKIRCSETFGQADCEWYRQTGHTSKHIWLPTNSYAAGQTTFFVAQIPGIDGHVLIGIGGEAAAACREGKAGDTYLLTLSYADKTLTKVEKE